MLYINKNCFKYFFGFSADACINAYMQGTNNWAQSLLGVPPHCQQNLMVYPGDSSILIFSLNDGNRSVILYNQLELPYVVNLFDFRVQTSFKQQIGPALNYPYYVPPRTEGNYITNKSNIQFKWGIFKNYI